MHLLNKNASANRPLAAARILSCGFYKAKEIVEIDQELRQQQ